MNDTQEQEFLSKVRSRLDAGLEDINPVIAKRLRECRQQAVDLADQKPFRLFRVPRLIPVGVVAALAVVAVSASLWFTMRPQPLQNQAAEEIEVLTVPGNLEMYKDLEFFQWLAQTHEPR
jgi:hypothetical protein